MLRLLKVILCSAMIAIGCDKPVAVPIPPEAIVPPTEAKAMPAADKPSPVGNPRVSGEAYANRTFEGEKIAVDGCTFKGCSFFRCELIYSGGKCPYLEDCAEDNETKWSFDGSAAETVSLIRNLATTHPEEMMDLIGVEIEISPPPGTAPEGNGSKKAQ